MQISYARVDRLADTRKKGNESLARVHEQIDGATEFNEVEKALLRLYLVSKALQGWTGIMYHKFGDAAQADNKSLSTSIASLEDHLELLAQQVGVDPLRVRALKDWILERETTL